MRTIRTENPALLRRLAQVSGGEAFFPEQLSEVYGHLPADRQRHSHPIHDRLRSGSIRRTGFVAEDQSDRVDARRPQVGGTHAHQLFSPCPSNEAGEASRKGAL